MSAPTPLEAACRHIRCGGYDAWFDLEADMSKAIATYLLARSDRLVRQHERTEWEEWARDQGAFLGNLAAELERGDKA